MAKVDQLEIRCNNCGALVAHELDGSISVCAYCGARYHISTDREVDKKAAQEDTATSNKFVTSSTPPQHSQFRININSFRDLLWLALILYVGVLGVGWMVSRVSGGGVVLLVSLVVLFAFAMIGRLHPKPPSFMARLSIGLFGNLFPMGVIWGLMINSSVVAILLAYGVPLKTETFPSAEGTSADTETLTSNNLGKKTEASVVVDCTCATLPTTQDWFGLHDALVQPQDRSKAISQFPDGEGHLFVLGKSILMAHLDNDKNVQFTDISNPGSPVLLKVDTPTAVIRESKGKIQFTAVAGKSTIAVLFYTGKVRRLVLVNAVTGKKTKPIILPGSTKSNVSFPSVAATSDNFGIVWRDRQNILGFVISEKGRVLKKIRLKDSTDTSEPRIAWNGKKFGIAYERTYPDDLTTGIGLFEFSVGDQKSKTSKVISAMESGWSSSNEFRPRGEMLWHDGAFHLAGTVSNVQYSKPQAAIIHFTQDNGTARAEICQSSSR